MEKIKIVFLGTGSAVPTANRNHSGFYFKYKNRSILVDCGEGIQRQFRKAGLNLCKLTDVLITHWHGDHVLGLPGLFESLSLNGYSRTLNIYGPKRTKQFVDKLFEIFIHARKIKMEVREIKESGVFFETADFRIRAYPLKHNFTLGYLFEEKDKRRINKKTLGKLKIKKEDIKKLGLLIKGKDIFINGRKLKAKNFTYLEKGRKIAFVFDTGSCDNAVKLAKDADLVIMDSSFIREQEELAREYKHLTAEQAAKIAKKAGANKLFLTHISQRNELREKEILKEAKKYFKNVEVARDLMAVEI